MVEIVTSNLRAERAAAPLDKYRYLSYIDILLEDIEI
jgi:hypothetical protein